ncbi:hypothetical protein Bbelb_324220 [Branchiostoma belcheri]|nr:hypothetical protein Bbelb_324220 [Branchiostoma belcheri]
MSSGFDKMFRTLRLSVVFAIASLSDCCSRSGVDAASYITISLQMCLLSLNAEIRQIFTGREEILKRRVTVKLGRFPYRQRARAYIDYSLQSPEVVSDGSEAVVGISSDHEDTASIACQKLVVHRVKVRRKSAPSPVPVERRHLLTLYHTVRDGGRLELKYITVLKKLDTTVRESSVITRCYHNHAIIRVTTAHNFPRRQKISPRA